VIYEYAIDPSLVVDWVINRDIGLAPQFGLDHRRVVSDFPENWEGEVTGAVLGHYEWDASDPDYIDANNFLNALLDYVGPSVSRGHINTNEPWLEQAIKVHDIDPFHAILCSNSIKGHDEVITPNVISDLRNTRWYIPTIDVTSKTSEAMAKQLSPLLRTSSRIILVDPYFEADKPEFAQVLSLLLVSAVSNRSIDRTWPDVTVMSGVGDREKPASGVSIEVQLRNESSHRCSRAKEHLGPYIPKGMKVTFVCIAQFLDGDQIHNRLLLTNVGGAVIPYGTKAMDENVFDDITPLFLGQYRKRWRQYGKGDDLQIIGNVVIIDGEMSLSN